MSAPFVRIAGQLVSALHIVRVSTESGAVWLFSVPSPVRLDRAEVERLSRVLVSNDAPFVRAGKDLVNVTHVQRLSPPAVAGGASHLYLAGIPNPTPLLPDEAERLDRELQEEFGLLQEPETDADPTRPTTSELAGSAAAPERPQGSEPESQSPSGEPDAETSDRTQPA